MNVEPSMSEFEPSRSAEAASVAGRHGGELLREQRMASGMHIVGLSAVLKVPVARLEALEAGRFEELPDLIFARALASSVCRVLKTDPAPILAALPQPAAPAQTTPPAAIQVAQPLRPQGPPMGGHAARRQRRFWVSLLLLLVLALLASGAWWWQQTEASPTQDSTPGTVQLVPLAPPVLEPVPAATTSTDAVPAVTEAAVAPVTAQDSIAASPAPVSSPAAASAAMPATSPASVPVLRLTVSQVTWVQVMGASGALRLERTLQPGESLEASDDLPLQVVVGRADAAEVNVRGQRFDLAPHTRNQVARFQVR